MEISGTRPDSIESPWPLLLLTTSHARGSAGPPGDNPVCGRRFKTHSQCKYHKGLLHSDRRGSPRSDLALAVSGIWRRWVIAPECPVPLPGCKRERLSGRQGKGRLSGYRTGVKGGGGIKGPNSAGGSSARSPGCEGDGLEWMCGDSRKGARPTIVHRRWSGAGGEMHLSINMFRRNKCSNACQKSFGEPWH